MALNVSRCVGVNTRVARGDSIQGVKVSLSVRKLRNVVHCSPIRHWSSANREIVSDCQLRLETTVAPPSRASEYGGSWYQTCAYSTPNASDWESKGFQRASARLNAWFSNAS